MFATFIARTFFILLLPSILYKFQEKNLIKTKQKTRKKNQRKKRKRKMDRKNNPDKSSTTKVIIFNQDF